MSAFSEDQPEAVRTGEEINLTALNDWLKKNEIPVDPIQSQQQFPGGYSNLTYLLSSSKGEFILRRPPYGAAIKSAHDMGREFKVLSLLQPHYKQVPRPVAYCEDSEIIGAPFYIMERLHGIILRPNSPGLQSMPPTQMKEISEALVDNLVRLHQLDIHSTGLDQLGKPEGYIRRQVEGWTKRYQAAETDQIPQMNELIGWLASNMPAEEAPSFLHNDYKYDNVVLNPDKLTEIVGVLDWEMSTIGDPRMDLGASLAYWVEAHEGNLARVFNISWLPGNLTRREVVVRYEQQSGKTIKNIEFFYAFGLFKNAVIAQQIYARWKQGHSKDARFGSLIHVIRDLAVRGIKAIDNGV
ncbi:MAG: phosphotransferase family protein [Bacteroidetes bacterium]|nr:phosphotransferase family protein [Bacteroidota bacterium]